MVSTLPEVMQVIKRYMPKGFVPKVGMILGSGLSSVAEQITNSVSIPYQALGLQSGAVEGHASLLVLGYINEVPVVCLRGRLHLYEGIPYDAIRTLVRLVKQLGAETLIVTCAAGSMQKAAGPGELMMLTDHINFHPMNPLVGPNDETIGPRFVDMENAYDLDLQKVLENTASRLRIPLHKGVYMSVLGPMFETPAEIRAYSILGADAIGMSVVPEVILARHCGLKVVGIAAVVNAASGLSGEKITHEGTLHFGKLASHKMAKLIPEFIKEMNSGMA